MAVKIGVMNQKGGVGKSTLVNLLADNLRKQGRILILDLDQQNNQRTLLGVRNKATKESSASGILLHGYAPESVLVNVCENVDLIHSGGKYIENIDRHHRNQEGAEIILKNKMESVEDEYDYILIDSNPTMNLIHANITCYADYIILPCDMEILSFSATRSILHFIESFSSKVKYPTAKILGIVPIRFDSRRNVDDIVLEDLRSLEENDLINGGVVFSPLRESANMKTAQAKRKFLSEVFPKGRLTDDARTVCEEVVKRLEALKTEVDPSLLQNKTTPETGASLQ